jgi:hypothetical protein
MQLGLLPAGAEVGVEFACGSRGRQLGLVSGRRWRLYFCHVKIAAGFHVGRKSPHFVDVAMRLA